MRKIREITEHSLYVPGLQDGGSVLDVGANRGRFGSAIAAAFPVRVISIEANPILAALLRQKASKSLNAHWGQRMARLISILGTTTRRVAFERQKLATRTLL